MGALIEMQDSWLSILGSAASVGAAIWAFIEARNASRDATKAEAVKNELIQRRTIVEVSHVYAESSRILKLASQVGPTCTKKGIRGLDVPGIAKSIEEYSRFLNEHSGHFNQLFQNTANSLCADLAEAIESLAEANTFETQKEAGKKIYYLINSFMPLVKQLADDKRENIQITT